MLLDYVARVISHQTMVGRYLQCLIERLSQRAITHDESKLHSPEHELYAQYEEPFKQQQPGSPEYQRLYTLLRPAFEHHYRVNRYHPEHHQQGAEGMTLLDWMELLCHWLAICTEEGRDVEAFLKEQVYRYRLDYQLYCILQNSARELLASSKQPKEKASL